MHEGQHIENFNQNQFYVKIPKMFNKDTSKNTSHCSIWQDEIIKKLLKRSWNLRNYTSSIINWTNPYQQSLQVNLSAGLSAFWLSALWRKEKSLTQKHKIKIKTWFHPKKRKHTWLNTWASNCIVYMIAYNYKIIIDLLLSFQFARKLQFEEKRWWENTFEQHIKTLLWVVMNGVIHLVSPSDD